LFKGLDPLEINYNFKPPEAAVTTTATTATTTTTTTTATTAQKVEEVVQKLVKEEIKRESASIAETKAVETIDLPSVVEYKAPAQITKHTDPLPHVQIGLQKVDATATTSLTVIKPKDKHIKVENTVTIESGDRKTTVVANTADLSAAGASGKLNLTEQSKAKSSSDLIPLFSSEERKLLKNNKEKAVTYLRTRITQTTTTTTTTKTQEKTIIKIITESVKVLSKKRTKQISYEHLTNEVKCKELELKSTVLNVLRNEIENGHLLTYLQTGKSVNVESATHQVQQQQAGSTSAQANQVQVVDFGKLSSSLDKLEDATVIRRFPSLTWREANERARILFYKGRVPSIHYNEKRDSFRVSMITKLVNTQDGSEKTQEIPVCDDDVRRLLNSYGLYWDGESISLLNKSDEIFTDAQKEAFDFIQFISTDSENNTTTTTLTNILNLN
jgi:hypothetical protein